MQMLRHFFRMESAGGVCLVLAAVLAMAFANSALAPAYDAFLHARASVRIGAHGIDKPLLLWINDGLMAVFFFLVGLEIKRELVTGQLSTREQALLPMIAALGGMIVPALIYAAINLGGGDRLNGWAIPAATDIAFALGVLSLMRSRAPLSMKIFLTAVAVIDDLGAIIIIAVFYSHNLSVASLAVAGVALTALIALNLANVGRTALYLLLGLVLWVAVLKSGVHATLAGVVLAFTIPLRGGEPGHSMCERIEHGLHPYVAFGVLPIFGFANAGVSLAGVGWSAALHPITLGIALGLFLGKQIGVFGATFLSIRAGFFSLPPGATWAHIYGVSLLCGIGFTMSLFIGGLAWSYDGYDIQLRLGVIGGSILSAIAGAVVLLAFAQPTSDDS